MGTTTKIITYQTPSGDRLDLTPEQVDAFHRAGYWPRNSRGEEYSQVSHGLHEGELQGRYLVVSVDENVMPTDPVWLATNDLKLAEREAGRACTYGGAIIDLATGLVDVGWGWVEQDPETLRKHIEEHTAFTRE